MRMSSLLSGLILFTCLPLAAQSNDLGLWYSTAHLDDTTTEAAGTTSPGSAVSFDDASGFGISYNHFWMGALSTEFAAMDLRADGAINVGGTPIIDLGRLKFRPYTANVQWHFARSAMLSPYIGAGVAYITADDFSSADLTSAGIGNVSIKNKTSWDANAGLNINIGRMFALAIDGKYIPYEPESRAATSNDTLKLKLNPLVLSAGVKLRF